MTRPDLRPLWPTLALVAIIAAAIVVGEVSP